MTSSSDEGAQRAVSDADARDLDVRLRIVPRILCRSFFLREADSAVVAQLQEPARQTAMSNSKSAQAYKRPCRSRAGISSEPPTSGC